MNIYHTCSLSFFEEESLRILTVALHRFYSLFLVGVDNDEMTQDKRYPWYVGELFVFIILNIFALIFLHFEKEPIVIFSPWYFLLMGLAVYRLANIISDETITKPFRAPFVKEKKKGSVEVEEPRQSGFRGSLGSLIYCPSCVGVWVAGLLFYSSHLWPQLTIVAISLLALSAIERVMTSLIVYLESCKSE